MHRMCVPACAEVLAGCKWRWVHLHLLRTSKADKVAEGVRSQNADEYLDTYPETVPALACVVRVSSTM